jgi:hypothetical protein
MMDYDDAPADPAAMTADDLRKIGKKWLDRIKEADKRERPWFEQAERATDAFAAKEGGKVYDFNILHSNIATIGPAIYNSMPVPDVRERFRVGNETPESTAARAVAQVIERGILVQCDDGALDVELEDVTTDALLAGRGIIRIRFDADEGMDAMGQPVMQNERLSYEAVSWRDYREGPASRWDGVPWVAFKHCLPWETVCRIQDPELRELLAVGGEYKTQPEGDADTYIWEVWDKQDRKVCMIVEGSGEVLSLTDDPLGLSGFFPCTRPVQPIALAGSRLPISPWTIYRKLAEELETITKRINGILSGIKVRGLMAGNAANIKALADAEENTLTAAPDMDGLVATQGLQNAVMWWPIEQAITVLQQLYLAREATKQAIYEVTGISDIVRGQSNSSETLGAQEIKTQWGSLRIRKMQRDMERCAREVFLISAELLSSKFSPETLQRMAGVQLQPDALALLGQPLDNYRIDVETDSTVRADLTRRKGEMGEFLLGTSQFFASMQPVVEAAPQMAEPVAELFAAFGRQFSLGKQAEDSLEKLVEMAREAAKAAMESAGEPSPEQQLAEREIAVKEGKLTLEERIAEVEALLKLNAAERDPDDMTEETPNG